MFLTVQEVSLVKSSRKRKRGGQLKPASQRKSTNLTIRLLDELRTKLEKAARASGRSVSEEAAWRMTLSFLLSSEIQDLHHTRDGVDDQIMQMLEQRGWTKVGNPERGGIFFIPRNPEYIAGLVREIFEVIFWASDNAKKELVDKQQYDKLREHLLGVATDAVTRDIRDRLEVTDGALRLAQPAKGTDEAG